MSTLRWVIGVSLLAIVPALWAPAVGLAVTGVVREVNLDQAYFPGIHLALIYLGLPVVTAASLILLMGPGLLTAILVGRPQSFWQWLLDGFVISLVLVSSLAAVLQAALGRPLVGGEFVGAIGGLIAVLAALVVTRHRRGRVLAAPPALPHAGFEIGAALLFPICFLVVLVPKFFWEAFNGDGAHTFEAARLLLFKPLPFFSAAAGAVAGWPGVNGIVVPIQASWFLRLFGPVEAAVRLPMILDMALLVAAIAAVAQARREVRLDRIAILMIWGSVISFALAMSFAATYSPYNADIALPGPMDTLVMVAYLAGVAAFINEDWWRLAVWSFLSLLISPSGVLLLAASLAGVWVAGGLRGWRKVVPLGAGLAAVIAALGVLTFALTKFGIVEVGGEHSATRLMIRQFGTIALFDFERVGWALIPTGLYPVAGLFAWRSADLAGRMLIVTTGLLFAFFYPMGALSLHYFVPVMIVPIAVFWRRWPGTTAWRPAALAACAGSLLVSIALTMPAGTAVYDGSRTLGERVDVTAFPGYAVIEASAMRATDALGHLAVTDAHPAVPDRQYGDSPVAWNYYAQRRRLAGRQPYVLARAGAPQPLGAIAAGGNETAVLYVYDEAAWTRDRALQPRRSPARSVLTVPRHVLFYDPSRPERPGFFTPSSWPWLRRLAGLSGDH